MADQLTRRTTLTGAAGAGLALPLLAACGSSSSNGSDSSGGGQSGSSPTSGRGAGGSGGSSGEALAKTSAIQVGSGKIFADQNVVVTQPSKGQFKAFSATCTHQGCQVSSISDGMIVCPCHGSQYSISTGAVEGGPAPSPLPPMKIAVKAGEITLES